MNTVASSHSLTMKAQYLRTARYALKMQEIGSNVCVDVSPLGKSGSIWLVSMVIEPGGRITIVRSLDGRGVSHHCLEMPKAGK